jgi:hypothetical protein
VPFRTRRWPAPKARLTETGRWAGTGAMAEGTVGRKAKRLRRRGRALPPTVPSARALPSEAGGLRFGTKRRLYLAVALSRRTSLMSPILIV